MEQNETGCPILCANNCGFFGSAATMNLCSKCHKDFMLKQEQAKLAASSIGSIVNGSSSATRKGSGSAVTVDERSGSSESMVVARQASYTSEPNDNNEVKEGPKRCSTCRKRVGLMGFNCRCGNLFCAVHRYSDKHDCPFDYRASGQNAIAKSNPVVKAEKLDKI